ncbi:MAG: tetratricopeptide repeat protein, partial [Pseudomonadota bacterium]
LLDHAGETDRALAAYERAEKNGFRGSAVVLRHGALLERIGRTSDAAALYRSILSAGPDDPAARAALVRLEAGVEPPLAPTIAEGAALGLFTLAGAVVGQIDVDYFLPYLTLSQTLDPKLDAAWLVAGEAQRQIKKPGAARAALQHVAPTSPWYEVAQARIALSYRDEEKTDEALAVAKALAERTGGRLARVTLADILRGADRWKEAEAIYDGLIAENQPAKATDWALYFARAACREELGRWNEAEADLKRALELAPDQPEALNFLGYSWVSKGINLSKGLALLQRAVSLSPDSGYIIDSLGWAQFQMGDFHTAVDTLESAVSLDPQDPTLNEHLGDAYWRVGRRIEARFQWTRALDQHPGKDEKPALEQKLKVGLPPAPRSPR